MTKDSAAYAVELLAHTGGDAYLAGCTFLTEWKMGAFPGIGSAFVFRVIEALAPLTVQES